MRADELRSALRFVGCQFARVGRRSFRRWFAYELARAFDSSRYSDGNTMSNGVELLISLVMSRYVWTGCEHPRGSDAM